MYVAEMTLPEAEAALIELKGLDAKTNLQHTQVAWDIEDIEGRISELKDWY
jgi:hypothetical protein